MYVLLTDPLLGLHLPAPDPILLVVVYILLEDPLLQQRLLLSRHHEVVHLEIHIIIL